MPKPDPQNKPEAPPVKKTYRARLGHGGIFLGVEEIDESDLAEGDLHLPDNCDLPPGKYAWDAAAQAFVPVPDDETSRVSRDVPTLNALAALYVALWDAGTPLPEETAAWLDAWLKTIDAAGGWSQDTMDAIARFRTREGAPK